MWQILLEYVLNKGRLLRIGASSSLLIFAFYLHNDATIGIAEVRAEVQTVKTKQAVQQEHIRHIDKKLDSIHEDVKLLIKLNLKK